jgi:TetR/AcrR family transcriptional repressor of nem operon
MNSNNNQNKRERLIDSAAILFHTNGVHVTSLADIAKHADIPIGNVYYYFKTKEELALAAIEKRRNQFKAAYALLEEGCDEPRTRLIEACQYYSKAREEYARLGCPIGKIIDDSDVTKDNVAKAAADMFVDFVDWATRQFRLLGHTDTASAYAITLIGNIQGAILMAKAFNDSNLINAEIDRLTTWLELLPNRKIQLGKVGAKLPSEAFDAA